MEAEGDPREQQPRRGVRGSETPNDPDRGSAFRGAPLRKTIRGRRIEAALGKRSSASPERVHACTRARSGLAPKRPATPHQRPIGVGLGATRGCTVRRPGSRRTATSSSSRPGARPSGRPRLPGYRGAGGPLQPAAPGRLRRTRLQFAQSRRVAYPARRSSRSAWTSGRRMRSHSPSPSSGTRGWYWKGSSSSSG